MAGLTVTPGRRAFWLAQLAHQAPMLGVMVLMVVTKDSVLGGVAAVAALWVIALARAGAARRSLGAREFLVDILAMALVVVVSLARSAHGPGAIPGAISGAMPGMAGTPGAAVAWTALPAVLIVVAWALTRIALGVIPGAGDRRVGSVLSGSCCAVGLVAMLLM